MADGDQDATALSRSIIFECYGRRPRWGDKYNEYAIDLLWLTRVLPEVRFLFLVRHPNPCSPVNAGSGQNCPGRYAWLPGSSWTSCG